MRSSTGWCTTLTVLGLARKRKQARRQRISDEELGRWVNGLLAKELVVEACALLLISMTGSRPCELSGISVSGNRIVIRGAKHSHGGLRGADRVLEASEDFCRLVSEALESFHSEAKSLDSIRMALHCVADGAEYSMRLTPVAGFDQTNILPEGRSFVHGKAMRIAMRKEQ